MYSLIQETHREIGRERRDAPCRPCWLHHERRAWVPVGHFRLELSKPRHSGHQGNTTKPPLFLYNHFIHPYTHSFHTPVPPGWFGPEAFLFFSVLLILINVLILVKCITKCRKMLKMWNLFCWLCDNVLYVIKNNCYHKIVFFVCSKMQ